MRSPFIKSHLFLAVACAMTLGAFSTVAQAQPREMNETALLLDVRGAPVMNATGLCWHTGYGPAPLWTAGCHAEGPTPVAQYVAPVVVSAAAQPLAAYEKVAFEADILFESDKSGLTSAGRNTLDAFVSKISGLDTQSVMAIGYADRMGTEADNQILSEERVNAVKAYLIGKGITPDRVRTSAWGETRPSTAAAECEHANTAPNVACMQPDRHVSVEISGSRLAQ